MVQLVVLDDGQEQQEEDDERRKLAAVVDADQGACMQSADVWPLQGACQKLASCVCSGLQPLKGPPHIGHAQLTGTWPQQMPHAVLAAWHSSVEGRTRVCKVLTLPSISAQFHLHRFAGKWGVNEEATSCLVTHQE